jgi:hypothetical protein
MQVLPSSNRQTAIPVQENRKLLLWRAPRRQTISKFTMESRVLILK